MTSYRGNAAHCLLSLSLSLALSLALFSLSLTLLLSFNISVSVFLHLLVCWSSLWLLSLPLVIFLLSLCICVSFLALNQPFIFFFLFSMHLKDMQSQWSTSQNQGICFVPFHPFTPWDMCVHAFVASDAFKCVWKPLQTNYDMRWHETSSRPDQNHFCQLHLPKTCQFSLGWHVIYIIALG